MNIGKTDIDYLVSISSAELLKDKIFKTHQFGDHREEVLNRNWVLHGRDDPRLWSKADFYSLICIISSMQTFNEILNK